MPSRAHRIAALCRQQNARKTSKVRAKRRPPHLKQRGQEREGGGEGATEGRKDGKGEGGGGARESAAAEILAEAPSGRPRGAGGRTCDSRRSATRSGCKVPKSRGKMRQYSYLARARVGARGRAGARQPAPPTLRGLYAGAAGGAGGGVEGGGGGNKGLRTGEFGGLALGWWV